MKSELRDDDFVFRIVKDPGAPPDTLLIVGFVGKAVYADHTRIYLDVLLAAYVDLPDTAILHAQRIPETVSPLGGSYVWVRRDLGLVDAVRQAYAKLQQTQQDYMKDFRSEVSDFGAIQPGWPQLPT